MEQLPPLRASSAPNTKILSLKEKMDAVARVERASLPTHLSWVTHTNTSAMVRSSSARNIKKNAGWGKITSAKRCARKLATNFRNNKALHEFQHHFDMMRNLHLAVVQEHYQLQKQFDTMNVQRAQWNHDKIRYMRDFKDFKAKLNDNMRLIQKLKDDGYKLQIDNLKLKQIVADLQKQKADLASKNEEISQELQILDGSSVELFSCSYKKLKRLKHRLETNLVIINKRLNKCESCKTRSKDTAFTCGHKVLCSSCARKKDRCPVCHKKIDFSNAITISEEYND